MSSADKSIHEIDFGLICDYFSGIERQRPGSPEVTIKALSFIDNLTNESRIAEDLVAFQKYEAELYRKYKEYYGYVFYIGRKI